MFISCQEEEIKIVEGDRVEKWGAIYNREKGACCSRTLWQRTENIRVRILERWTSARKFTNVGGRNATPTPQRIWNILNAKVALYYSSPIFFLHFFPPFIYIHFESIVRGEYSGEGERGKSISTTFSHTHTRTKEKLAMVRLLGMQSRNHDGPIDTTECRQRRSSFSIEMAISTRVDNGSCLFIDWSRTESIG